jgi:hypothetical protein
MRSAWPDAILALEVAVQKLTLTMLAAAALVVLAVAESRSSEAAPGANPRGARYGSAWSADRTVLAWQDETGVLWVVRRGRQPQRLLSEGEEVYNEGVGFWDWAPRGHLLVSTVGQRQFVVDAQTGRRSDVSPIPTALYEQPLWSPSGDLIAYVHRTPKGGECDSVDIGVAPASGGSFRTVANLFRPTAQDAQEAASDPLGCGGGSLEEALVNTALTRWSPDGRALRVASKGSESGTPLRRVKVNSRGPKVGAEIIAELTRGLR